MPVTFYMVGPTGVGKSSLAVEVAARCGAEIVGADAFQVYAGLDLLTAKPNATERERVPHHLVGTVSPAEAYDVARYAREAGECIDAIHRRRRPVLIVGGTGLYVKALTHGLSPLPEANVALRAELEALDAATLLDQLRERDQVTAESIDRHNKRRLVRALEVCLLTGQPFSSYRTQWNPAAQAISLTGVFLTRPKADLQARIERRVQRMFAHGVVDEVRATPVASLSDTASRMIGWRDITDHLRGRQTLGECQQKITVATRQYAKRQMTWFQREKFFECLDLSTRSEEEAIAFLCARVSAEA